MANENPIVGPSVKNTFRLPSDQINNVALAKEVLRTWTQNHSSTTFNFTDKNAFETLVNRFEQSVNKKQQQLALRKTLTNELTSTTKSVSSHLKYLKTYLMEEFGEKDAKSYFAQFGIKQVHSRYILPADRDVMLQSLNALVATLTANPGLATRHFGLAFWTDLRDKLTAQWQSAKQMDTELALLTSSIKQDQPEVKQLISRMKAQLKIDNPTTHTQLWRAWGLQTEKF